MIFAEDKSSFPMMLLLQQIRKELVMSRSRMNGVDAAPTYRQQLLAAMRIFLVAPLFQVVRDCGAGRCGR
jgi:hypothetical protein